jgi:nicotinamide mononucleotide transporter
MKRPHLWIGIVLGLGFIAASWQQWVPFSLTETLGFVTGVACVYLAVKQNIWNFPLGLANNIFFLVLFTTARLYGDAGLQVVYIVLGLQGWYYWLYGGQNRTSLRITHASLLTLGVLAGLLPVGTAGLILALRAAGGAAPALDAFTTVLSLLAQYLLNRKAIENWYLWIAADILYIYLYISRGLHLTAILYFVFLGLCIIGLREWQALMRQAAAEQPSATCEVPNSDISNKENSPLLEPGEGVARG